MTLHISKPEPGTYKIRLVKGGPWVPVKVWRPCQCTISGPDEHAWQETCDRFAPLQALQDGHRKADLEKIWPYLREITESEYEFLAADGQWCRDHAPQEPAANPTKAIDLNKMDPLF